MLSTQGGESNHSGQFLEDAIEMEFRRRGVKVFSYAEKGDDLDLFEPGWLIRQYPYVSMYGCRARSEFLYRRRVHGDIRIECRQQTVSGSVDEKFPYFFQNALTVPEHEVWLVVDGGGAKPSALRWLKAACAREESKIIRFLSIYEARAHIKNLLASPIRAV